MSLTNKPQNFVKLSSVAEIMKPVFTVQREQVIKELQNNTPTKEVFTESNQTESGLQVLN